MADEKLTDAGIPTTTNPATTDIMYVVTTPGGTPASKKVTIGNLRTSMSVGMVRIAQVVVGVGGSTTIDFSSIPATYESLKLVAMLRNDKAATLENFAYLRFNNDSSGNYDYQVMSRLATTQAGNEAFAQSAGFIGNMPAASATASTAAQFDVLIAGYARTVFNKSYFSTNIHKQATSTTSITIGTFAGFWRSTAAINQITIVSDSDKFVEGSVATLYGIT